MTADTTRQRVRRLLAGFLGVEGEGPDPAARAVALHHGTAAVFIRLVEAEPPVVRVFSPLVHEVEGSDGLLAHLNGINAEVSFARLFWRDGTVYAAVELLAAQLDVEELANACEVVAAVADRQDVVVRDRFGGRLGGQQA